MDYLRHVNVVRVSGEYRGTCLRCGFTAAAASEEDLRRAFEAHTCSRARTPNPSSAGRQPARKKR